MATNDVQWRSRRLSDLELNTELNNNRLEREKPGDSHYFENFEGEIKIGFGGQGSVFKAKHVLSGCYYAVKKVRFKQYKQEGDVVQEVMALAELNHPHVVRYHYSWVEEDEDNSGAEASISTTGLSGLMGNLVVDRGLAADDGSEGPPKCEICCEEGSDDRLLQCYDCDQAFHIYCLRPQLSNVPEEDWFCVSCKPDATLFVKMELCQSTLRSWIEKKNDCESDSDDLRRCQGKIKEIFREILLGLEHIHAQGIIHRDLKPGNIFLTKMDAVKIGDFGLCKRKQTASQDEQVEGSDFAGTPVYAAPEITSLQGYDSKVDIYSLGIIYLEMLVRITSSHELMDRSRTTRAGDLPEELQADQWTDEAGHLLNMLRLDPEQRWSARDLLQSLYKHPPCTDERIAHLERTVAMQHETIKKYKKKWAEAKVQQAKQRLKKIRMKLQQTQISQKEVNEFTKDLKKARKRRKKVRSRNTTGERQVQPGEGQLGLTLYASTT